ncbi:MAG: helix-turn-helix domain-containing protein [Candidatus Puniceispirillaceae bacterium]
MSTKRIRALERGLVVIEALSQSRSLSLTQLRAKTGLDNATLLRIIATLIDRGWVRQLIAEKKYELSHSLEKILGADSTGHPMAEIAEPILLKLKDNQFGLPSDLCAIMGDGQIEIVESTRQKGPLAQDRTGLGLRPSLFLSAHGRIILSSMPLEQRMIHVNAFLNRARKDDVSWYRRGLLKDEIAIAQKQGFARREKDYWEPPFDGTSAIGAIAVIIKNDYGIHGSLSLLWLEAQHELKDILQAGLLDGLNEAAAQIAASLAHHKIKAL